MQSRRSDRPDLRLLQPMPERQDRCFIRDPVTDQVNASESAQRRPLNQGILHGWIVEVPPLPHQMNPQHGSRQISQATALGARFGVTGLDQVDQRLPGNCRLHFLQKPFTPSALFGLGQLVITKDKLLAAHQPSPYV